MQTNFERLIATCILTIFSQLVLAADYAIEEIIVEATKRSESVQDVPIAINVVDAGTIEALGIDEYTDITKVSPSLTVGRGDWATNSSFNLRGIGTMVFSINIEPSVAIIVDDVPLVRSEQAFSDLSDIQTIEVLRGPQSTLFGKSASAGVINIRTKAPSDELTGSLRITATDDDEKAVRASLSGPLGDTAGFRLSAFTKDREDGHITNILNGDKVDGSDSQGVRGKFYWDVTDSVSAQLTVETSESEVDCCHQTFRDVPAGAAFLGFVPGAAVLGGVTPSEDNDEVSVGDPTETESENQSASLRIEADIGDHQFISVSSMTDWDYEVTRDLDGTNFDLLAAFTGGALSGGIIQGGGFELESFTQEFRLVSPASDHFEYVIGLYYSDISYDRDFQRGPVFGANWIAETGSETLALYGQGTWSLTEKTDITAGLRLNREEISQTFDNLLTGAFFDSDNDDTATPGKISLQHYPSDDVMWFASYSIGYKGQGYDISSSFRQATADNPVGEEDSQAFEFGMKSTFMDGRLQFNPTVFFATYDDFQAQQARIVDGVVELGITNVGELETYGVEVDFQALLTENLRLVGGLAWTHAEIKTFDGADCWSGQAEGQGCLLNAATGRTSQDLGGKGLNNSPDFKLTLSAEYTRSFDTMPFDGYFNVSYRWQSDVNFSLLADPGAEQEAFGVVDMSMGIIESSDRRYEVSAFIKNAFGEEYVTGIGNFGALWGGTPVYINVIPRAAKRYAGIRLGVNF